jgi:hypothetical protein
MQTRWFWKNWPTDFRFIVYGLGMLLLIAFLLMVVAYLLGPGNVIDWTTFQYQVTRETISHAFEVGSFEFFIPIESYLTFEYFNGSRVTPNTGASYFFLFALISCALVLLSVITTLERFWFISGIGLFVLFMVSLRFEVLRVFNLTDRTVPIIIITLFALVAFYLNTLRSSTPFLARVLVFTTLTLLVAACFYFFSQVDYPFLHLATSAYVPGLILSVIFILMVAHEIMAGFIYVTSSGTSSSKSLRHFMVITVIYLGNLLLAYLHEAALIDWDFLYINPYLLMTVSILLGIWGFRQRENLYENILPFNPYGAYLVVALSIITLSTTGMLLGNHNDVGLKVIRDVIIFSHLGYGVIFFIYVVSNFMVMMAENLPAWKVLYKPTRMPYFTFRFAGLIATMAFVFYSGWREYVYYSTAGFYYQLADLYQLMDQRAIAEAYHQQARKYVAVNNRTNYILGLQESSRNDFKKAHNSYELANTKRPTPYSMANDANLFIIEGSYFEGINAMRQASEKFGSSGILQNNSGYAYARIHKLDSALILFDQSRQHKHSRAVAEANFFALIGNEYLPVNIDSLYRQFSSANPFTLSNALAGATQFQQSLNTSIDLSTFTRLEPATAALLNNYVVHHVKSLDTAFVNKAFRIANDSANADYSEALKATLAHAFYHQQNVTQALSAMAELAFLSQIMQGKFNYIAGLWALEQGSPELAISYFEYAVMFNYKEARLYNTLALAEAGYLSRALAEADSLLKNPNEDIQQIGRQLKKIITLPAAELNNLNDLEKYQFCRYRLTARDTVLFNRIVSTIGDNDLKVEALLDMSERQYDLMDMPAAIRYLNQTGGIPVRNKKLVERIQHHELIMLAARGEIRTLTQQINAGVDFRHDRSLEKLLYQALLQEVNSDTLAAEKNYAILANYNPFFEAGIIAASRFYKRHSEDVLKPYRILAEAIQVNTSSYRLWMAYRDEARAVGFDRQADDAQAEMDAIKQRR